MKASTIKQKIRDVVRSGMLGLPDSFKSSTLEMCLKGMARFAGDYASDKRPLHLPLLAYVLCIVPFEMKMGAQFGYSAIVATFTCLRQSEYS